MNNVIMRKITLTAEFQPLSAKKREVASVDISTPPTNTGLAYFRSDLEGGEDVPLVPGEFHALQRVNLPDVFIRGQPGDIVTVIGGTW